MSSQTPLSLQEIQNYLFAKSIVQIGKEACFRRYHILLRDNQNYRRRLTKTFEFGVQKGNLDQFLEIGSWLAEICYFDSNYAFTLKSIQGKFLQKIFSNLHFINQKQTINLLVGLVGKLLTQGCMQALLIETAIKTSVLPANAQIVNKELASLQCAIKWQIYLREIFLKSKKKQFFNIIQSILKTFQKNSMFNHFTIIVGKSKLLSTCLKYFICDSSSNNNKVLLKDQSLVLKKIFTEQIWKSDSFIPSFEEDQMEIIKLFSGSVKLYGVYDEEKFSNWLSKNQQKIRKIEFLEIIRLFVEQKSQIKTNTKENLIYLLKRALNFIFQPQTNGLKEVFKKVNIISDIIVQAVKFSNFNFNKDINHLLKFLRQDYHRKYLTTLFLLQNKKLKQHIKQEIAANLQNTFQSQQSYEPYEELLRSFSSPELNISCYTQVPETKDEVLLWDLLTLRNSIKIDYLYLNQHNLISGIYRNLIKFVLCNVFYKECTEIVHQICKQKSLIEYGQLQNLSLCQLINEIITFSHPCFDALTCFSQILQTHKRSFLRHGFQGVSLFTSLAYMLRVVMQKMEQNIELSEIGIKLLRTSLPELFVSDEKQSLQRSHQSLLNLMEIDTTNKFFTVYLDFMYLSRYQSNINYKLTSDRVMQYIYLNNSRFQPLVMDKFQILQHIIQGQNIQYNVIDMIWNNIRLFVTQKQKDMVLYFIQVFNYYNIILKRNQNSDEQWSNQNSKQQKKEKIKNCIQIIDQLFKLIDESVLTEEIYILFSMVQTFQETLHNDLIQTQIQGKTILTDAFCNMPQQTNKWLAKMEAYGRLQWFRDNKIARQHWTRCYNYLMLITCVSYHNYYLTNNNSLFCYQIMRGKLNYAQNAVQKEDQYHYIPMLKTDKLFTQQCYAVSGYRFNPL